MGLTPNFAGKNLMRFLPWSKVTVFGLMLLGAAGIARPAEAVFTVDIAQQTGKVVATGSGTIDLAALHDCCISNPPPDITASLGRLSLGANGLLGEAWDQGNFHGPVNFGSGGLFLATSGTGDHVEMAASNSFLAVPIGYVSGAALSDSATWNNATISSLGLTPGTYTWAWGSGAHADSFVIDIEAPAPAVPEPASLALLVTAVLGLGTAGRLTRRYSN
jgi:hypothetical protein